MASSAWRFGNGTWSCAPGSTSKLCLRNQITSATRQSSDSPDTKALHHLFVVAHIHCTCQHFQTQGLVTDPITHEISGSVINWSCKPTTRCFVLYPTIFFGSDTDKAWKKREPCFPPANRSRRVFFLASTTNCTKKAPIPSGRPNSSPIPRVISLSGDDERPGSSGTAGSLRTYLQYLPTVGQPRKACARPCGLCPHSW